MTGKGKDTTPVSEGKTSKEQERGYREAILPHALTHSGARIA
jgi:hypothetical protein